MSKEEFKDVRSVARLWVHECERVLSDRLMSDIDKAKFKEMRINTTRKFFDDVPQVRILYCLNITWSENYRHSKLVEWQNNTTLF